MTTVKEFFTRNKKDERDIESCLHFNTEEQLWNASCSVLIWPGKPTLEAPEVQEVWGKGESPEEAMQDAVDNWLMEFEK